MMRANGDASDDPRSIANREPAGRQTCKRWRPGWSRCFSGKKLITVGKRFGAGAFAVISPQGIKHVLDLIYDVVGKV
jgi:hypothetical protein